MAWIVERPNGYLVRWRDRDRKTRSRFVRSRDEAGELKTAVEAEHRARRVLAAVPGIPGWDDGAPVAGVAVEPEFSFERYARRLIESDGELRRSSREGYEMILRTRIDGTPLGQADIRTIGPDIIQAFWETVGANRRNVHQMLTKTFNAAAREGIIESSPMLRANVKRPNTRVRPEDRVLSVPELELLADAASSPRGRLAILLMGYCGLRAGEVAGLRVQDVHHGRLTIRQAVVQAKGLRYVSEPKTRAARRTVAVPASVYEELVTYSQDHRPAVDGRIFHGGNGELWSHAAINHIVQKSAKRAGLLPTHAHQLRHTAVSLLIDDGANPKAIQVFVGHANITETLQTYGHLFDYGGEALAASMERRREAHRNGVGR